MKQMYILVIALLHYLTSSTTYSSLRSGNTLKEGDDIVSTLGYYKLAFISNDCSLNLYRFSNSTQSYELALGKYKGNYSGSCKWLNVIQNKIVTDTSKIFLSLSSTSDDAYLIIDDIGIIRFIGTPNRVYSGNSAQFQQKRFDNFSQPNTFISILQSFATVSSKFINGTFQNNGGWHFQIISNRLTIQNSKGNLSTTFSLPTIYFSQSGIFDNNNQTYPYSVFDGLLFSNLCGNTKKDLVGPFVMEIDQFWPVVRIYDQQGYKIFQYSFFPNEKGYNPCPKNTFWFKKSCLLTCPLSYYHSISSQKGECTITCEKGSIYDNISKVCFCPNRQIAPKYSFTCINTKRFYFGCYCENNTSFNISTQRCINQCPDATIQFAGVCIPCSPYCSTCQIIQGYPTLAICTNCSSGYSLNNGVCVINSSCAFNCLACQSNVCIACIPFYSLINNFCIQQCPSNTQLVVRANLSSYCSSQITNKSSCPLSCQLCSRTNASSCIICKPGYILLVSPFFNSCRRKTILFSCTSIAYNDFNGVVCYSNQSTSLTTLKKCVSSIPNCFLCLYQNINVCITCINGYLLQENSCVTSCSQGYYTLNQGCVRGIPNCSVNGFLDGFLNTTFNLNTVTQNGMYSFLTNQGNEQINEPYGYSLFTTKYYQQINDFSNINAILYWSEQSCFQCQNGFGLSKDHYSCIPCPSGCLLCLNAFDGSCIAKNTNDLSQYTNGNNPSRCKQFLTSNLNCTPSCPSNTIPFLNPTYKQLGCQQPTQTISPDNYLKIDGTTLQIDSDNYLHIFIFGQKLQKPPLVTSRLLTSTLYNSTINSIIVQSNQPYHILNLSGILPNYQSVSNTYPPNSIYGLNTETSYRTFLKKSLAIIGYILSLIILITHCIYVGNELLYKMDNIIIFCQSIFYFLFVRVLISNPVSQYYYGWSWIHLNFYPNYFSSLITSPESSTPAYALYNIDANFIRNAGVSISFALTFLIIWAIVSVICYFIDIKTGRQVWYSRIWKNSLIAMIQLKSFNVFYWAVAFFNYDLTNRSTQSYPGLAVLVIIIIIFFTFIRCYFNFIAGAYMIKRIVYASVLGSSYQKPAFLAILIIIELLFTVFRVLVQKPKTFREKIIIFLQTVAVIFGITILYLVTHSFAVAFIITFIVYAWYLTFVVDLVDLYLITKNKVLLSSWIPCLNRINDQDEKGSSKDDINDANHPTDRPFQSNVSK